MSGRAQSGRANGQEDQISGRARIGGAKVSTGTKRSGKTNGDGGEEQKGHGKEGQKGTEWGGDAE